MTTSCAVAFSEETRDTATGATHALVTGWAAHGKAFVTSIGTVPVLPCFNSSLCVSAPGYSEKSPQVIVSPPLRLPPTETAQISLVNTAAGSSKDRDASCQGSASFYNSNGSTIGTPTLFALNTGQAFSLKLPYISAGAPGSSSLTGIEIALAVTPRPCALVFSIQTYDKATRITDALISGTAVLPSPIGSSKPEAGH